MVEPAFTEAGEVAAIVKLGGGLNVNEVVVEWLSVPLVPLIVTV